MDALLITAGLAVVILAVVIISRRRTTAQQKSGPQAAERKPNSDHEATPIAPPSFYNLRTVGDFLKLVGMRVCFGTKQDGFFEGDVEDISDSGTHLILRDVKHEAIGVPTTHHESKSVPVAEIDFVKVIDRRGKLP
jgi:hypothetical protein